MQCPSFLLCISRPDDLYCERKYIVTVSSLHALLKSCSNCGRDAEYSHTALEGAYAEFLIICRHCTAIRTWTTSPKLGEVYPLNILLSGSILFTGALPAKTLRTLSSLNIAVPAIRSHDRYQHDYLHAVSIPKIHCWRAIPLFRKFFTVTKRLMLFCRINLFLCG